MRLPRHSWKFGAAQVFQVQVVQAATETTAVVVRAFKVTFDSDWS